MRSRGSSSGYTATYWSGRRGLCREPSAGPPTGRCASLRDRTLRTELYLRSWPGTARTSQPAAYGKNARRGTAGGCGSPSTRPHRDGMKACMAEAASQGTDSGSSDLRDLLRTIRRRRWLLAAVVGSCLALGVLWILQIPKEYAAQALLGTSESQRDRGALGMLAPLVADIPTGGASLDTHKALLTRKTLVDEALRAVGLELSASELKSFIDEKLTVSREADVSVLSVEVRDPDPGRAADIANKLVELHLQEREDFSRARAREAVTYIEEQMETVRMDLLDIGDEVLAYKTESGITDLQAEVEGLVDLSAAIQTELNVARGERMAAAESGSALRGELSNVDEVYLASSVIARNPVVTQLEAKLVELEASYQAAATTFGPQHTRTEQLREEIETTRAELRDATKTIVAEEVEASNPVYHELYLRLAEAEASQVAQGAKERALASVLEDLQSRLATTPIHANRLGELEREELLASEIYVGLFRSYHEAKLNEIMGSVDLKVIDWAQPPEAAAPRGRGMRLAISLMVGILLAALAMGIAEALDTRVHAAEALPRILPLPVLAHVPWARTPDADVEKLSEHHRTALRRLRTALLTRAETGLAHYALLPASKGAGCSTLVARLVRSSAHGGISTLAIDASADEPTLHDLLGVEMTPGFWNVMAGQVAPEEATRAVGGGIDVMPAGDDPVDPEGLLLKGAHSGHLAGLGRDRELVLMDLPPLDAGMEAGLVAAHYKVVLVVRLGHTRRDEVARAAQYLVDEGYDPWGWVVIEPR
ncbi:MAG: hypothetical protein GF320_20770 [Armatimonadia bacterium]|nr:hypothetical protein [Armatimonadia bacterium]